MKLADLENPQYKNLGHVVYTGRVKASSVFKYLNLCIVHFADIDVVWMCDNRWLL